MKMPPGAQADQYGFECEAKEVEREHIEQQVPPILVDKTAGEECVDVAPTANTVRMEHKPTEEVVVGKRVDTGDDGKGKNDASYRCLDQIFFHALLFNCRK